LVIIDLSEDTAARTALAQSLLNQIVITVGGEEVPGLSHVIGWPPRQRELAEQLSVERFDSPPTDRFPQIRGRVLIVDDSPLNRRLLAEFLTLWGLDFDEADDGAIAVSMWEKNHYKLIIMDCQMPILDGLAATAEIRSRESPREHIPVLALTAHAMASDAERCIAAGMDDYLSKPLMPDSLRRKITQLLFNDQHYEQLANSIPPKPAVETIDEVIWNRLVDLQSRSGGDLLAELVEMYGTQGQELTMKIRKAIESNELETLRPSAHRLKGTAASIGAARVAEICRNLEEIKEPPLARCDELEAAVAESYQTLLGRLSD
jgi:two-component system sensor histidine kinase/response regulator